MKEHRVIWRGSALCKGLHCIVIWTIFPIRIRESFKKELCQQFTLIHIRLSYHASIFAEGHLESSRGGGLPLSAARADKTGPVFRHPLYGETP